MPTKNPATYDPTSATPYEAPELPQVQPPNPSPLPPPEAKSFPLAPSKAGGIASVVDNVMRGFMQGRAQAQVQSAQKLDNTTKALQASYNLAAKNLQGIVESNNITQPQLQQILKTGRADGVDDSVVAALKQANQAVQGSWQSWTTFLGEHVSQDGGKKKGGKKGDQGQQLPFMQRLAQGIAGKDPAEVSKAIYDFYVKSGPPVYSSLASITASAKQKADSIKVGTNQQDAELTRDEILKIPEDKRTPEQKQVLQSAEERLTDPSRAGKWDDVQYDTPEGIVTVQENKATGEYRSNGQALLGIPNNWKQRVKAGGKVPMRFERQSDGKWVSMQIDPNTNQPIAGTEDVNAAPPSNLTEQVRNATSFQTDADGHVLKVDTQSTTQHVPIGGASVAGGQSAAHQTPGHQAAGGGHASVPQSTTPSGVHDTGIYKGSQQYKDLEKERSKANISLNTLNSYLHTLDDPKYRIIQKAKNGDGPAQVNVVASFVKGVIGGANTGVRVTQTEWNQAVQTAPILERIGAHFTGQGIYGIDVKGVIAPEQVDSMLLQLRAKQRSAQQTLTDLDKQMQVERSKPDSFTTKTETSFPNQAEYPQVMTDDDFLLHLGQQPVPK